MGAPAAISSPQQVHHGPAAALNFSQRAATEAGEYILLHGTSRLQCSRYGCRQQNAVPRLNLWVMWRGAIHDAGPRTNNEMWTYLVAVAAVPTAWAWGVVPSMSLKTYPSYLPGEIAAIEEPAALKVAESMQRVPVELSEDLSRNPVPTNFVSMGGGRRQTSLASIFGSLQGSKDADAPVLMIHGFDSSLLEWRRLLPALEELGAEAWAYDVLGWGFTGLEDVTSFSADAKKAHLYSFWKQAMNGRPMVLVGASLGGALAIDFCHTYPETVSKLVLIDAQGFIDGTGPAGLLPRPLARGGIRVLKSKPLRSMANQMAYFNKDRFATEDAMNIGRLHVSQEGWEDASVDYMCSGGFAVSSKVPEIEADTLVLWGRNDEILKPELYAERFVEEMPSARLQWVEDCGHVPHLEQPAETAAAITSFMRS